MPEEMLNQALENEEGLFDDISEDTPIEEVTNETDDVESTSQAETPTEVKADEPFLNITYNKENVGLSKEEAIALAQKGKNYDKLNERFTTLSGNLEHLARQNGLTVEDYLKGLNDAQTKFEVSKEFNELKKQYPHSDDAMLNELAQSRVKEKQGVQQQKYVEEQQKVANEQKSNIQKQIDMFNKIYPKLEADKLDDQVYEYMKNGYTLLESYSLWKDAQQSIQAQKDESLSKIQAANEANKKKSLGNISNRESAETDAFMDAFLSY